MHSKSDFLSYWFIPPNRVPPVSYKTEADKISQFATKIPATKKTEHLFITEMAYFSPCISTKSDTFVESITNTLLANSIELRIC